MGGLDFRPQRVHQAVTELLKTPRLRTKPVWYDVVGRIPPAQTLVRTLPVVHRPRRLPRKVKKPSKMFQPHNIVYPEDYMRERFYSDHPWELARPRIVLEDDGMDARRNDWSRLVQPHRQTDGESVIQRQKWLLENEGLSNAQAYDIARKEFYKVRYNEEVERKVAREEALAVGATFGKSYSEVGMELEDKEWEKFKAWAMITTHAVEARRLAQYRGLEGEDSDNKTDTITTDDTEGADA